MTKSIRLRKPIMVEGKIISKGARILVESEDIEDVGVVDTTPAEDTIDYDVEKAKRLARIRKLRAMKKAEAEVVTADENDDPVDFPADEIQALRRMRMAKLRKLRAMKKAEDEEIEEEDEETVEEKKKRLARIRKLRAMKMAKKSEDEIEEEDEEEPKVDALRKARLARIRKIRAMKKAEDEEIEEDEDFDDSGVVADKCNK